MDGGAFQTPSYAQNNELLSAEYSITLEDKILHFHLFLHLLNCGGYIYTFIYIHIYVYYLYTYIYKIEPVWNYRYHLKCE